MNPNPKKTYKITNKGKILETCRTKAYAIHYVVPKFKRLLGRNAEIKIEKNEI